MVKSGHPPYSKILLSITMDKDQIVELLTNHRDELLDLDVRSLALFGSVARGESGSESDVDILVKFEGLVTFDKYMEAKIYLEDLLGCQVDLVIEQALRPQLRPYVEKDAIHVA
jgi:predicted nucleotidyltransferase